MNVESIKDNTNLCNELYNLSKTFINDYPDFPYWFYYKQLPESILTNKREILFVRNNNKIIGFIFLKNYNNEKKICTMYVDDKYRNKKIGTMLLLESFKYLKTDKPYITMRDYKVKYFEHFIKKYNWSLDRELNNYYGEKTKELCFNIRK